MDINTRLEYIKFLRQEGFSYGAIGHRLGISKAAVYQFLRTHGDRAPCSKPGSRQQQPLTRLAELSWRAQQALYTSNLSTPADVRAALDCQALQLRWGSALFYNNMRIRHCGKKTFDELTRWAGAAQEA